MSQLMFLLLFVLIRVSHVYVDCVYQWHLSCLMSIAFVCAIVYVGSSALNVFLLA